MAENIFNDDNTQDSSRASDIAYAIDVKFMDLEGEGMPWRINDVTSIQIIRNSLEKLASITILTAPLDIITEQSLELMLKQKKYPRVHIDYQQVDPNKPIAAYDRKYTVQNTFHLKKYKCIQIKTVEKPTGPSRNVMTHLILCNELVFYLSNSHRYNKAFYNKTLQWIFYYIDQNDLPNSGYQGFLRMFGKNSKNQNSIWLKAQFPDEFVNQFRFEQVLIKTHSDLHVLRYLMDTYKYTFYPSVVFFDDFYLPTPNREIELMAIMLMHSGHPANLRSYVKFDVGQAFFAESMDSLRMINNTVINDHMETINYKDKDQENNILINTPGDFLHVSKKLDVKYDMPNSTQKKPTGYEAKDELLYTKFKDSPEFEPAITQQLQANQSVRTFTIDNHENQKKRMESCQHLLNTEIEGFYTFESNRIHFDAIQFERRYNFDTSDKESYSFVPVIIVNTFTRKDAKDTLLRHSCRFQCIRYETWKEEDKYPVKFSSASDSNILGGSLKILESATNPLAALDILNDMANNLSNSFNIQTIINSVTDNLGDMLGNVTDMVSGTVSNITTGMFKSSLDDLKSISDQLGVDFNVQGIVNDIALKSLSGGEFGGILRDQLGNASNSILDNVSSQFSSSIGGLNTQQLSSVARNILSGNSLSDVGKSILVPILKNYNSSNYNDISNIIEKVNCLEYSIKNVVSNVSQSKEYSKVSNPNDLVYRVIKDMINN